jgi:hypothetical protein
MYGAVDVSPSPLLTPAHMRSNQPAQVRNDQPASMMPKPDEMRPILTGGRGLRLDGTVGANLRGQQPLHSRPPVTALAETAFAQEALRQVTRDGEGWPKPIIKGGIVNGRGGRQYVVSASDASIHVKDHSQALYPSGWLARNQRTSPKRSVTHSTFPRQISDGVVLGNGNYGRVYLVHDPVNRRSCTRQSWSVCEESIENPPPSQNPPPTSHHP